MVSRISIGLVGALFGWSMAQVTDRLAVFAPETGHYRVENALSTLRAAIPLPSVAWILGSSIICIIFWEILASVLAVHRRGIGVRTATLVFAPVVVAAAINLSLGDPTLQSGRLWLTGAMGLTIAGTAIMASYVLLRLTWDRNGSKGPGARFVWALSLLLYLVLGLWMSIIMEPTGDEPHYLLGMHSITHDGDLDVANNHENQDYLHFYPTEIHNAQMLETRRGITLPKHSVGLMIIGAPFYAVGGRIGVSIVTSLVCAALAGVIFHYISRLKNPAVGALLWGGMLLSAPLALYPGQIYPNATTALLVGLALMSTKPRSVHSRILGGLALGLVPWFHLGTWPLAVGALGVIVRRERKPGLLTGLAALIPWLGLVFFHYYFWGAATPPVATYGDFALTRVPAAFGGQFLDQEAGILWIAPLFWLLLPGFVVLMGTRRERRTCLLLLGWLVYVSTFSWWYGGWCPTGRFLLPVLVLIAVPLSEMIDELRGIASALWTAGTLVAVLLTAFPFFRFNAHDGSHAVLDVLGALGSAVASVVPSVVTQRPVVWVMWIVASGIWTWFCVRKLRHV